MQKNTSKALANFKINNNYWSLLNHVPQRQVGNIVTKRVLEMDQRSCEALLKRIIEDQRLEDTKRRIQQAEREAQRSKLRVKNQQRAVLADRLGVKLVGEGRSRTQVSVCLMGQENSAMRPGDKGARALHETNALNTVSKEETEVMESNTPFGFTDRSHLSGGP